MPFFFSKKPGSVANDLRMLPGPASGGFGGPAVQEDAFEVELLGHLDALYAVSCRLTKSGSEAEDLVQDTIVKAIRAKGQFESGTNLKAWLLRILTNTFINRYRRGGLERDVLESPEADPLQDGWISGATMRGMRDAESNALAPIVEGELQKALDALPDEFRLAVILSDVEELSYKEIAEVMGCPIGTVMSRLHRGRKMLQKSLRGHAEALGIVPPEAPAGDEADKGEGRVRDLSAYRKRKGVAS